MTSPTDALKEIWQASMETAHQCAQLALDGTEWLFGVHTESLRDICHLSGNEYLTYWFSQSGNPHERLPELITKRLDFVVDLTRQCHEAALQTQGAFCQVVEQGMPMLRRNMQDTIDAALPPL